MIETIRYNESLSLNLDSMKTSLRYKLLGVGISHVDCGVGFDLNLLLPVDEERIHVRISVDLVYCCIRVYVENEDAIENCSFKEIRSRFIEVVNSVKEYLSEERMLTKLVSKI